MKFNWGTGAFALFTGFVIFIISMVFLASGQRHELVTENYYEKELSFKEVLEQKARTQQLENKTAVRINNKQLLISLPTGNVATKGTIELFKPSSKDDDRSLVFEGDQSDYGFDLSTLNKGMYKLYISWTVNGEQYYHEQKIDL